MKIKFKLIASFSIIIGLTVLLGIFTIIEFSVIQEKYEHIILEDLLVLENAQLLQKLIVDAETGQRGFIITGEENFLEPYYGGIGDFESLILVEKELVSKEHPAQIQRLEKIEGLFEEWQAKAAIPEIETGRQFHAGEVSFDDVSLMLQGETGKNLLDQMRGEFETFIEIRHEDKNEDIAEANETKNNIVIIFIAGTATIAGIGISIALYSSNEFTRPLIKLGKAARTIAKGKQAKIDIKGNDEITDLSRSIQEMSDDLKALDRKKEEFISMVSHELKTPLVPIGLYSEMLLDTDALGKLTEDQRKAIKTIYDSMNDLKTLISDVLDINKLELGKLKLRKKVVNVQDFVKETIEKLKPFTEPGQAKLSLDMKIDGKMDVDTKRVFQVISNLVKNALKFVPKNKGVITMRVHEGKDSMVLFSVEDNGIGIPIDKQKKLFQKFYQVDSSATRDHGGTGLGLSISHGIVETHGGKIWYDSDYKGGAKFKFTLPRITK